MSANELKHIQETLVRIEEKLKRHEIMLGELERSSFTSKSAAESTVLPTSKIPAPSYKKDADVERTIGMQWLAWVGFFSFVTGVGLFLKYAFEMGWLTESARVILGYIGGLALIGAGTFLRKRYASYGNVIQGIGVAILYLVTFAAFNLYGLIGQMPALGIMVVITVAVALLGQYMNAPALLATSFVGGYLTPLLIHTGTDPGNFFFPYLLLLNIAVFFVTRKRKESRIALWGLLGTILLFGYWLFFFYTEGAHWFIVNWLIAFSVLFLAARFLAFSLKPWKDSELWDFVPLLLIPVSTFITLQFLQDASISRLAQGFVIGAYALLSAASGVIARVLSERWNTRAERVLFAAALYAMILAIGKLLPKEFVAQTIGFGLEAIAIFGLGVILKRPELRLGALVVLFRGFLEASAVHFPPSAEFQIFLSQAFTIRIFILACLIAIAGLYRWFFQTFSKDEKQLVAPVVFTVTHIVTLWLISSELGRWFDTKYVAQVEGITDRLERKELSRQISNQRNIVVSIFWGLYGVVALFIGFLTKSRFVRIGGLLLLIVTILKVALHDFWNFGTLYRMIVSLSLGVVFLLGAFFYHRFQNRIKQFISE